MLGEARLLTSSIEYTGTPPTFPAAGTYFFCLSRDGGSTWYEQSRAALVVRSMHCCWCQATLAVKVSGQCLKNFVHEGEIGAAEW